MGVRELYSLGDQLLLEETSKVFKKEKDMQKGIAFPTCLSVNNCICHFSPLVSDADVELKKARMGVVECVAHKLLEPFHVLYEKPSEMVAQFKFTVLLMPNGPQKITGIAFDPSTCQSEHS